MIVHIIIYCNIKGIQWICQTTNTTQNLLFLHLHLKAKLKKNLLISLRLSKNQMIKRNSRFLKIHTIPVSGAGAGAGRGTEYH